MQSIKPDGVASKGKMLQRFGHTASMPDKSGSSGPLDLADGRFVLLTSFLCSSYYFALVIEGIILQTSYQLYGLHL